MIDATSRVLTSVGAVEPGRTRAGTNAASDLEMLKVRTTLAGNSLVTLIVKIQSNATDQALRADLVQRLGSLVAQSRTCGDRSRWLRTPAAWSRQFARFTSEWKRPSPSLLASIGRPISSENGARPATISQH